MTVNELIGMLERVKATMGGEALIQPQNGDDAFPPAIFVNRTGCRNHAGVFIVLGDSKDLLNYRRK